MSETFFKLPNQPEEFGITLAAPALRKIDFSALEFETLRRAQVEYLKTYYGDTFNDFTEQNGVVMLMELISYVGSVLSLRADILADEAFLPTAQTTDAVINHLELINQKIRRPTPAVVDVEVSVGTGVNSEIKIQSGLRFNLKGSDGNPLTYELYRAPGDWDNPIVIPPSKRGVIAHAVEGAFQTPVTVTSAGGAGQTIDLVDDDILDEPIIVEVSSGNVSEIWHRVEFLELQEATDNVYQVKFFEDKAIVMFGDDKHGKAPLAGQQISVKYRRGGGIRGRIGIGAINESRPIIPEPPFNAPVEVLFRNLSASSGGTDAETLDEARRRAPRDFATHNNAVSAEDYAQLVAKFAHPMYGSVLKSAATIRTSLNANVVELYVLAQGPDNVPVVPSAGLKKGLKTYLEDRNVLTDEVRVLDGAIKPIDVEANIVMSKSAISGKVKKDVDAAIEDFFNLKNFEMGQGFFLSKLYAKLQSIDGVQFVDLFQPHDDVIPTKKIAESGTPGVGFNELIVLGNKQLRFYFEKGRYQ